MRTLWISLLFVAVSGPLRAAQPTQQVLATDGGLIWTLTSQVAEQKQVTRQYAYSIKVPVTVQKEVEVNGKVETQQVTEYQTEMRTATRTHFVTQYRTACWPVDSKTVKAFETDGRKLTAEEVAERCKQPTLVVVSGDDQMIPDYYAAVFKPGTIILALPPQPRHAAPMQHAPMPYAPAAPGEHAPAPAPPAGAPRPMAASGRLSVQLVSQPAPQPPIDGEAIPQPVTPQLPGQPAPELVFISRDGADNVKIRQFQETEAFTELTVLASDSSVARQTMRKSTRITRHSETTSVPWSALRIAEADGGDLAIDRVKEKLGSSETTALLSVDGALVDVFWLQNIKPSVLVLRGVKLQNAMSCGPVGMPCPVPGAMTPMQALDAPPPEAPAPTPTPAPAPRPVVQ